MLLVNIKGISSAFANDANLKDKAYWMRRIVLKELIPSPPSNSKSNNIGKNRYSFLPEL